MLILSEMATAYLIRQTWYNTRCSTYCVTCKPLPSYAARERGVKYTWTVMGSATGPTFTHAQARLYAKYRIT